MLKTDASHEAGPNWGDAAEKLIADCPDLAVRGLLGEFHASAVEVAYRIGGLARAAAEQDGFGHLVAHILNLAAEGQTQSSMDPDRSPSTDTDGILERCGATQGVIS